VRLGRKQLIVGGVLALALGAIAYANLRLRRPAGPAVTAEAIQNRDLDAVVSASGKIEPKRSVNISADTMGRVTELAVNEGDAVRRGQFLMQIDPRTLQTAVQQGEASVQASRSALEQARVAVETARAQLALAEENLRRQRELWERQLISRETLDRVENEVKVRQTELQEREQQVRTQESRIAQERAGLERSRYELGKVRIESPIDGIVTRRNIEEGETVVVGTMNNPGTVLLTIADMSVIEAEVEVDETDIPSVQIGQTADVTIDAVPDRKFTGRVTEIGNSPIQQTTTGSTQTGQRQATNFKVVVTLGEPVPAVRPGFTCTADITTARRAAALAVPIQALTVREVTVDESGRLVREPPRDRRRRGVEPRVAASELKPGQSRKELEGVFVVRDGRAEFMPVRTGIAGDRYFEILEGLRAGDRVITGPFSSVRELADGNEVTVEEPRPR
jgi:HlyD family secretion protein